MGAIQNSVNSVLGTAAIGAAAWKHSIDTADAAEAEKVDIANKAADIGADVADMQQKGAEIMADNPEIGTPGEADALEAEAEAGGHDLAMAKKALETLGQKITARQAQLELLGKRFANVGKSPIQRLFGGRK